MRLKHMRVAHGNSTWSLGKMTWVKGSSAQPLAKKGSVSRWDVARNHGAQQESCRTKPVGECTASWFLLRGSNLRHSSGIRILLLRIHLLTWQHVEREPSSPGAASLVMLSFTHRD